MARKLKSGIWIAGVRKPAFFCRVCHAEFFEGEDRAYQQHVVSCAESHAGELEARSLRNRLPGLYGADSGDTEYERWVRENPRKWAKERGIDPDSL